MPGMDGTGPMGLGPMTGGGRGWCNPYFVGVRPPLGAGSAYFQPYGFGVPGGYGPRYPLVRSPFAPYASFARGRGFGRCMGRRRWW